MLVLQTVHPITFALASHSTPSTFEELSKAYITARGLSNFREILLVPETSTLVPDQTRQTITNARAFVLLARAPCVRPPAHTLKLFLPFTPPPPPPDQQNVSRSLDRHGSLLGDMRPVT